MGLILILCIQFYFWLHLHELNKKIDASSPGWDVAWVGMYNSVPAKLTMWISACLLPLAAVFILSLKVPTTQHYHVHKWVLWALCFAAIMGSATLAVATAERLENIKADRGDTTDARNTDISNPS